MPAPVTTLNLAQLLSGQFGAGLLPGAVAAVPGVAPATGFGQLLQAYSGAQGLGSGGNLLPAGGNGLPMSELAMNEDAQVAVVAALTDTAQPQRPEEPASLALDELVGSDGGWIEASHQAEVDPEAGLLGAAHASVRHANAAPDDSSASEWVDDMAAAVLSGRAERMRGKPQTEVDTPSASESSNATDKKGAAPADADGTANSTAPAPREPTGYLNAELASSRGPVGVPVPAVTEVPLNSAELASTEQRAANLEAVEVVASRGQAAASEPPLQAPQPTAEPAWLTAEPLRQTVEPSRPTVESSLPTAAQRGQQIARQAHADPHQVPELARQSGTPSDPGGDLSGLTESSELPPVVATDADGGEPATGQAAAPSLGAKVETVMTAAATQAAVTPQTESLAIMTDPQVLTGAVNAQDDAQPLPMTSHASSISSHASSVTQIPTANKTAVDASVETPIDDPVFVRSPLASTVTEAGSEPPQAGSSREFGALARSPQSVVSATPLGTGAAASNADSAISASSVQAEPERIAGLTGAAKSDQAVDGGAEGAAGSRPDAARTGAGAASNPVAGAAVSTQVAPQALPLAERMQTLPEALAQRLQNPAWGRAIGQRAVMMAQYGPRTAEIQLDPPELGALQVRVHLGAQDQVSVSFSSPHAHVRDALEQQMPRLRELFAEQGLNLGQSSVADQSGRQSGQSGDDASAQGQRGAGYAQAGGDGETPAHATAMTPVGLVDYYA